MKRCWTVLLLAGLVGTGLLAGCAQSDKELLPGDQADAEKLRELARSLVPSGATIAAERDGACEMFRDFPDCRTVGFYDLSGVSREARVEAAEQAARRADWTVDRLDVGRGGTRIEFLREGYTAWVSIRDHVGYWQTYCEPMGVRDRDFVEDCTDTLQVQREPS
jgi:hypothetical protein